MPRYSHTGHARKFCACAPKRRLTCAHPWYADARSPKGHPQLAAGERFRKNLDALAGEHLQTLQQAQAEARRAIEAWLAGRDPVTLQPTDRPTLSMVLAAYRQRPDAPPREAEQIGPITKTVVKGRTFGDWRITEITREALEAFQQQRPRVAGNRNLALLRAMFSWAVVDGLVPASPFKVGGVTVVKLRQETARSRRLQADESDRLIAASRTLTPLVVAALESGCRLGELLSLQWSQVRFAPRAELFLPAQKTKAKKDRRIPMSTTLQAVLTARKLDPAGELLPADRYVFGDEIGRRRRTIKTAWRLTCRRAGITDLHFHDLRREAGSRWMDAGVPLATIQRWLGHHNISQTSQYLAASLGNDADDMRTFEERTGRVPLPHVAQPAVPNSPNPTQSVPVMAENAQQNSIDYNPSGVIH